MIEEPKYWWIYLLIGIGCLYLAINNYVNYDEIFSEPYKNFSFRHANYFKAFNLVLNDWGGKFLVVSFYFFFSLLPFMIAYRLQKVHKKNK